MVPDVKNGQASPGAAGTAAVVLGRHLPPGGFGTWATGRIASGHLAARGWWSKGEGAWRKTPLPCIKLKSPYTAHDLGLANLLPFHQKALRAGCTVSLRPRQQRGPVLVLVAPSLSALQELYLDFLDLVRAAGLDAEWFRTRHAVLQCDPAPFDDFLAGRWSEAFAQTHDEDLAPP